MKTINKEQITYYINVNPNITAAQLANEFGYSKFHFSREFKKKMGVSLREYLSAIKLENGTETLLKENNVTHAQIDAGYENIGAFSHNFKKFAGYSPKKHLNFVANAVKNLHLLSQQTFNDAVLYKIYNSPNHQQTNHLDITVNNKSTADSLLFVGLFTQALPKSAPVFGVCLKHQSTYTIQNIPNGTYYAMVIEVMLNKNPSYYLVPNDFKRDVLADPITFPLDNHQSIIFNLRDKCSYDPPVILHPLKLLFDVVRPPV